MAKFCSMCGERVINGICPKCGNIEADEEEIKAVKKEEPKQKKPERHEKTPVRAEEDALDIDMDEASEKEISFGYWFVNMLLLSIPLLNIGWVIKLLVSGKTSGTVKNYVKASIVIAIITYIAIGIIVVALG